MYRTRTKILLLIVTVLLISWNISMLFMDESEHYISNVIRDYSWRFQTIPIALGALIGHWLTGFDKIALKSRAVWLFPIGAFSIVFDFFGFIPYTPPLFPFLLGLFVGWFFWPMCIPEPPKERSALERLRDKP